MCSRLNCRFVHLTEDDKVEVCDQRVAVCRDHANGQCRRKLCKYYHIPVALPPANIMATIFNQQPAQQPLHHQQLAAVSTISPNEQKQEQIKKQQLTITTNVTRSTSATYTSISNHNNNNNLMSSFSNNIIYKSITEKNNNTVAPHQHNTMSPPPLSRQISSSTTTNSFGTQNYTSVSPLSPKSRSESSNIFALTTSTNTIPSPVMATTASNLSAVANAYTPTFQRFLKTQQLLTPALGYYDIINQGLSNIDTSCFPLLSSNPTYAAAPMLYTATTQHQNQDPGSGSINNKKKIQLSASLLTQHPSNTTNLPETVTTSTK